MSKVKDYFYDEIEAQRIWDSEFLGEDEKRELLLEMLKDKMRAEIKAFPLPS